MGRFIAAFDMATACGCCDGADADAAQVPRFWTWHLSDAGDGRPRRLAYLRRFCDAYFAQQQVDEVIIELPLPLSAMASMARNGKGIVTNEETVLLLRGGIGVIESCAAFAGVPIVRGVDIKAARKHLLGRATFPAGTAKTATLRGCRALGWTPESFDEADAGALWALAAAEANPRLANATRAAQIDGAELPPSPRAARRRQPRVGVLF